MYRYVYSTYRVSPGLWIGDRTVILKVTKDFRDEGEEQKSKNKPYNGKQLPVRNRQ